MIRDLLLNKSPQEKAVIKAQEIAKLEHRGIYTSQEHGITVEIQSLKEIVGGVEIMARAWKNGKPLGFGSMGFTEIERFRIINPPILVDDPTGNILLENVDRISGKIEIRRLREDSIEAIRQSLAYTIKVAGKENTSILEGSIGNTTSTFYASVQDAEIVASSTVYATVRSATTGTAYPDFNPIAVAYSSFDTPTYYIEHSFFVFDVAATIGDTDSIDSATLSFFGNGSGSSNVNSSDIAIVESTQTAEIVVGADFDNYLTTELASRITIANWVNTAGSENAFTLNASGRTVIDNAKAGAGFAGFAKFMVISGSKDLDNSAPTGYNYIQPRSANQAGTSTDPTLVVVHTAAAVILPETFGHQQAVPFGLFREHKVVNY